MTDALRPSHEPADSRPSILVADDDPDIRDLITIKLRTGPWDVTAVADGDQAHAALTSAAAAGHPFSLAVLDVTMPGRTGLEVCQAAKADPATASTLILLLTARAQKQDVEAGTEAGADDYLTKPFSPRELAARVGALLGTG